MMPSKIMDQRHLSQFHMPSAPSSFFSQELRVPSERQVGFWKADSTAVDNNQGTERTPPISGSKPVSSSPVKKLPPIGRNTVERLELPRAYASNDQKANIGLEHHLIGIESTAGLSMSLWGAPNQQPTSQLMEGNRINLNTVRYENGLFSSSLSDTFNKKLSLSSNDVPVGRSVDTTNFSFGDNEPFESLEEIEAQTIGNLLPGDEDLFSGIIVDHDYITCRKNKDDFEDDLFCSGGGMELEASDYRNANSSADFFDGETSCGLPGGFSAPFAGEHTYAEHPSRTLFVRNINSNVENAELSELFQKYGDIRELYTMCKNRGFVMVSYYDARAAHNAMKALQNYPLGHKKLDIHYSFPKDYPSEKDMNQGTLVVFNLDSSVSNDDLLRIFGVYGEVKEIRETPYKHHHKFIEFYDARAAESALHALNKSDIAGKKIKLEPSRPGGARRCLMQQISPQLDREEAGGCKRVGPSCDSPSECFVSSGMPLGEDRLNILDNLAFQDLHSAMKPPVSPFMETAFHGISSGAHHSLSSPMRMATVNSQSIQSGMSDVSHSMGQMNSGYHCMPAYHPHSLPDYHGGIANGIPFNSPSTISAMDIINTRPAGGIDNRHIHEVGTGSLNNHSFGHNEGAFGIMGNGSSPLHSHQYLMNSSDHRPPGAMMWQNSPTFVNSIPSRPPPHMHGFPRAPSHLPDTILSLYNHHVGSAPAMNPSMWDRQHAHAGDTLESSGFHPASLGNMGFSGSSLVHPLELASHSILQTGGQYSSLSSAHARIPSPQQRGHIFHGKNIILNSYDVPHDRARSRKSDVSSNQADNKKQYELDVDRIMRGEDSRTTLMLKNIPNKYTSKMLIATIDEHHRGTYNFIYLPIDFKNKCNVGYAFINMINPQHIIPFYQAFNGKKWEKFNSEKVASLAYARIQGRQSLIAHFQNSSLMNEDKRCRPILFHTDGPNAGDQEPFPIATNIRSRPGRSKPAATEGTHQGSPSTSSNGDESSNAADSSPVSNKESE